MRPAVPRSKAATHSQIPRHERGSEAGEAGDEAVASAREKQHQRDVLSEIPDFSLQFRGGHGSALSAAR